MTYDFTSILDRHGLDALAVDSIGNMSGFAPEAPGEGIEPIPMWVADMNFPTAPAVTEAIRKRVEHPAFGYFLPRKEYYDAILSWHRIRHGIPTGQAGKSAGSCTPDPVLTPECIGYENGVLGGVVSALNVLCSRGDKVLVHSPTYIGFTNTLRNNGYQIIHSPLLYRKNRESGFPEWEMDYEDMEKKICDHHIHAAILCSPHNPCGRVWTREELVRAYAVFEKYGVTVISDEIWSDLILAGHTHIPSQSVSEYARQQTVSLYAPSKTFNLAGLVGSYHIIYNRLLRERIRKESSLCHYNEMNVLSMHALIGGYSSAGQQWVDELREVLTGNVRYAVDYIRDRFEGVTLAEPEGTYMLFPDCEGWCSAHDKTLQELEQLCWGAGVALQDGRMFHGPHHLRINLALPLSRVQEAMRRLDRYVFNR